MSLLINVTYFQCCQASTESYLSGKGASGGGITAKTVADHLAAKGHAFHAAIASGPGYAHPITAPIAAPIAPVGIAHPVGYAGPLHIPQLVAHPNGAVVPADEPAVVAAKADHFRAKGLPVAGPIGLVGHGLVAHPNGALVPAEPADVVAARADHLATHG